MQLDAVVSTFVSLVSTTGSLIMARRVVRLAERWEFHFLDKQRLKREIDSLRNHCTNNEEGCQWVDEDL